MRYGSVLTMAAALLVAAGGAVGAPCRLDRNDHPINCLVDHQPKTAPARPSAAAPPPCVNPRTGKPMKCLPVMLTPQRVES